jgi:hypothetical protein
MRSSDRIDDLNARLKDIEERLKNITCADLRSGASLRMIVDAIMDLERVREALPRIFA